MALPTESQGDLAPHAQSSGHTSNPGPQTTAMNSKKENTAYAPSSLNAIKQEESLPANLVHLELFRHVINADLTLFGYDQLMVGIFNSEIIDSWFLAPYLMNQILALASFHLSMTGSTEQRDFRYHALQLRAHALQLFRSANPKPDAKSCLPIFLFTSIRAFHVLSESLLLCPTSFDHFLASIIEVFRLHEQVRIVTNQSWKLLLKSPLKSLLEKESIALETGQPGQECSKLLSLVNSTLADPSTKDVYQRAIRTLQQTIDGSRKQISEAPTVGPIISWLVLVPSDFIDLLSEHRPESLITLAHFGGLLHMHRDIWAFGHSGRYIIDSVASLLGPRWGHWLQWPNSIIQAVHGN